MLKIYIARHGQDQDNASGLINGHRDRPLTEIGRQQAQTVASKIKKSGLKFEKIYSSPLKRTSQTAKIIARELKMPVEKLDLLVERSFGNWDGIPLAKIPEITKGDFLHTPTVNYILHPPGGESFPALLKRAKKILNFIQTHYHDGNILLVASGDIGKMIYATFYNLEWQDVLKLFHFGNSDLILISSDSPADQAHVFQEKQYNDLRASE